MWRAPFQGRRLRRASTALSAGAINSRVAGEPRRKVHAARPIPPNPRRRTGSRWLPRFQPPASLLFPAAAVVFDLRPAAVQLLALLRVIRLEGAVLAEPGSAVRPPAAGKRRLSAVVRSEERRVGPGGGRGAWWAV